MEQEAVCLSWVSFYPMFSGTLLLIASLVEWGYSKPLGFTPAIFDVSFLGYMLNSYCYCYYLRWLHFQAYSSALAILTLGNITPALNGYHHA